jgi:hypothetical protein
MQSTTSAPAPTPIRFGLRVQFVLALGVLVMLMLRGAGAALRGLARVRTSVEQGVERDGRMSRLADEIAIQTLLVRRYEKDLFLNLND